MPTDGSDATGDGTADESAESPTDEAVVEAAATAAQGVVFSRFDRTAVTDLDVTVEFEDGVLEVDVYLNAPEGDADPERVADDAALAARGAVDDLFESA